MHQVAERMDTRKTGGAESSQLQQLKACTKIVADTGDFETLEKYAPEDATTNPSLLLKAAQMPAYRSLVDKALADGRQSKLQGDSLVSGIMDELLVSFGVEILKVVPGRVSTETDADLSFDTEALIQKARKFIKLYQDKGVEKERVLIKVASTWEGIRAAEVLAKEGIRCNMTLLFSLPQAVACAEAKATLISPFVGRILDWYKAKTGNDYSSAEDPGVLSVKEIYRYFKTFGYATEVMGASFRNRGEILELAGCDALTISPQLLEELRQSTEPVPRKLDPQSAKDNRLQRSMIDEKKFRWLLNENAMATEKLAEGIRLFNADAMKLKEVLARQL